MLVLASKSPRRRELLKLVVSDFISTVSDVDEAKFTSDDPYELPIILSKAKAEDVLKKYPNDTILASDTIVICEGEILGKPIDEEDASRMLHQLSGKSHDVVTGFAILSKDKKIQGSALTKVIFEDLTDECIQAYIQTGSPMDKAGAYGIQDKEFHLVKEIKGSYYNVMGLPVEELKKYF